VQPDAPSRFAADVPRALDALVMSLLSLDPLSRPVSAALVIDQLTVIAGLEREDEQFAGEAYLRSSRMVGRCIPLSATSVDATLVDFESLIHSTSP